MQFIYLQKRLINVQFMTVHSINITTGQKMNNFILRIIYEIPIQVNGKYGYIDKSGNFVIKPQFDHASDIMAGLAHVIIFEKPELTIKGLGFEIDKAGNVIGKK